MHLFSDSEFDDQDNTEEPIVPDDLDRSKPLVLLLGNVDHEGITSQLKAGGEQYKKKILDSTVGNWQSILKYFDEFEIRAVVIKLNGRVYDLLDRPDYLHVGKLLFSRIAKVRHIAFVFQSLLSGEPTPGYQVFWSVKADVGARVNHLLREYELNVVPYKRNAELTVLATEFLKDAIEQLLFRVYVPTGRLWANEVDRLLQLFRDYLLQTGRKGVRLEQTRTDRGIAYEFHGDYSPESPSLSQDFQDFSHFLDLCVSDPAQAEELLRQKSVSAREVFEILARYSKEAKRLQIDLKHDRERKLLSIRQRLESELADSLPGPQDWGLINRLVDSAVPSAVIDNSYALGQGSNLNHRQSGTPFTVNLNPQIIGTVNGLVAHEISGDVSLSENDQKLLALIKDHGGSRAVELTSAVHELSDPGLPKPTRLSGAQKLKAFIYAIGPKLGGVAANILQEYIEHKIGLK
jgi:hypothetical protein